MKFKLTTAAAAALIAGVAGLTTATVPTAAVAKITFCTSVFGSQINKPSYSSFSGWKKKLCVRHTVWTNHSQRPVRAVGAADFKKYIGPATLANRVLCRRSRVTVRLYRKVGSQWTLVQTRTVRAKAKILFNALVKCSARVGTQYTSGSTQYRTVVTAFNGEGHAVGNVVSSLIRSHPHVI